MLKIRLKRQGRHKQPHYRIVVADSRVKRDGKTIKELGFYDPFSKQMRLNVADFKKFLEQGARPTDAVEVLARRYKSGFDSMNHPLLTLQPNNKAADYLDGQYPVLLLSRFLGCNDFYLNVKNSF